MSATPTSRSTWPSLRRWRVMPSTTLRRAGGIHWWWAAAGFTCVLSAAGFSAGRRHQPEIRDRLAKIAEERGVTHLHTRLREIDPEAANRIGVNDLYRIVRALEVFELTGETISTHQDRHRFADIGYDTLTVGVEVERKKLYEAIDARFDAMVAAGLVEEVRALITGGYSPEHPPLSTIGYKQIAAYLRGEIAIADAAAMAKQESRRLAKRQLTWFRREPEIVWLDPGRGARDAFALFEKFFRCESN